MRSPPTSNACATTSNGSPRGLRGSSVADGMRRSRLLLRLLAIQWALLRHGLDEIVWRTHLLRPVAWLGKLIPRRRDPRSLGARLRLALEELGPIFVKFGQALSVRPDLLPPEVAAELAKLQDEVPPFPGELAVAALERAFGRPVDDVFAEFDRTPLAAASIAQVHAARLKTDGRAVVVKVLRPNVGALIQRDVEVLHAIAGLAEAYWPEARRLHPREVVAEFEKTLATELDLMREAANAAQLKRNFAGSDLLYVPEIYWDFCRPNVLTMERIFGIQVDDMAALHAAGTNIQRLAENGVEIFFTQVFRHNFFHADMHPGNIFVDVTDPEFPRYVAVDFGIVGTLEPRDQHYLAENFLAFFKRDYQRVAALHIDSGWVPPGTRVHELEAAVRAVCEPIFNKPLKDISFGLVLLRLFQIARRFNMEIQPQLVLLQKTLLAVEGLGRVLYPELDLWKTAQPVLEDWMRQRHDPRTRIKELIAAWPEISDDLALLPRLLHQAIRRADMRDAAASRAVLLPVGPARGARIERAIGGAALLISGALWSALATPHWIGWVGAALGAMVLLWTRR
jgi:ubiquinone biosynthesis protein